MLDGWSVLYNRMPLPPRNAPLFVQRPDGMSRTRCEVWHHTFLTPLPEWFQEIAESAMVKENQIPCRNSWSFTWEKKAASQVMLWTVLTQWQWASCNMDVSTDIGAAFCATSFCGWPARARKGISRKALSAAQSRDSSLILLGSLVPISEGVRNQAILVQNGPLL